MSSKSQLVKVAAFGILAAALSLGLLHVSSVQAGQPNLQATEQATSAATSSTTQQFPPCPSMSSAGATPAATATAAATQLSTPASTPGASAGFLGVSGQQVENCGVRVVAVIIGSPAEKAQLQLDDVIVAVNGKATTSVEELTDTISSMDAGDNVEVTIQRQGLQMDIPVTLGLRPPDGGSSSGGSGAESTAPAPATSTP